MVAFAKEATADTARVLQGYLARGLGRDVRLTIHRRYPDVIHTLVNGKCDMAILSPLVYLNVAEAMAIDSLAYGVYPGGNYTYRSVCIVAKDGPLRRLRDLRGKKVAYVDKLSVSGYVFPKILMKEARIEERRMPQALFTGNHSDSVMALRAGKVDGAWVYDLLFAMDRSLGVKLADFRVLARSEFVPSDVFVTTKDLAPALRGKIRELLLDYGTAQRVRSELRSPVYEGFVPADPNLYESLRATYRKLVR